MVFTNYTYATSVAEPWPKTLDAIFIDDLGWFLRRSKFFVFYCVSQQWYHERSMSRCMFRSRSYVDMRHWFSFCFPVLWSFLLLDDMMRFCYKDWFVPWSLYAAHSMLVASIMDYIKFLGSHYSLAIENFTWTGLWILWTQIHTGVTRWTKFGLWH